MRTIYIIGGGMGSPELLTTRALSLLKACDEVYAFDRLAELYASLPKKLIKCSYTELLTLIEQSEADIIGILVSGDTGFYSAAKLLNEKLGDRYRIVNICGLNSLQYFCSKLNLSYEAVNVISLHGRNKSILGSISYNSYSFVLTGSDHKAEDILIHLTDLGLGHITAYVGECLSMQQERITTGTVQELSKLTFDTLSVILFENNRPVQKERPLFDEDFIREKTPMTKQEVRWASVNNLEIQPEDILFDIGAGTGSVAIEMSRKAYDGVVYAIEQKEEAYHLLNKNREQLGAYNVIPVLGNAAEKLKALPVPDKVFVGGSGKELKEILQSLFELNPDIKLVINAIALETLNASLTLLKEYSCKVEVTCINVSKNKMVGEHSLMIANNPVYIITSKRL